MKTVRIPLQEKIAFTQESASRLSKLLMRYESSVMIHDQNRTVNAKSLLGVLSLGYLLSDSLEFHVDGEDEEQVCAALEKHFDAD